MVGEISALFLVVGGVRVWMGWDEVVDGGQWKDRAILFLRTVRLGETPSVGLNGVR